MSPSIWYNCCILTQHKKLTVDKLPIIKIFEKLDYKQLLAEYKHSNDKDKKPVNSRGKHPISADTICPQCGAPHNYIYDNAGAAG